MSNRSIASGHYRLVAGFQSSSNADDWYAVCTDPDGILSCDCSAWVTNASNKIPGSRPPQYRDAPRTCKHTDPIAQITRGEILRGWNQTPTGTPPPLTADGQAIVDAISDLFPGLLGEWWFERQTSRVGNDSYVFLLARIRTGNGISANAVIAFATRHLPSPGEIRAAAGAWLGYSLAAQIARAQGNPMMGQPPARYRHTSTTTRTPARPAPRPTTPAATPTRPTIGLTDIAQLGRRTDTGDGLTPAQRADNMLRLFLGTEYTRLIQQGYLDVPSSVVPGRVYRVRRATGRTHAQRVRVFETAPGAEPTGPGRYVCDYCIVPATSAAGLPRDDWWLTVFMGLMTDERRACGVVSGARWSLGSRPHTGSNVFGQNSDITVAEPHPTYWRARPTR